MKITLYIIYVLVSFSGIVYGQRLAVGKEELKVVNDLCSTFKTEGDRYAISPFIAREIDLTDIDTKDLAKRYAFNFTKQDDSKSDTLILKSNEYFTLINQDSLLKYQTFYRDSLSNFIDPVLQSIGRLYQKNGIITFKKVIISNKKDFALVQYWMYCGLLCGYGETVVMKKIKDKWEKFDVLISIVS